MRNHQAFTLIELLVVVLIIGILASVALPQYTMAVNKARFANLRAVAKTYINAAEAYQLANGNFPSTFDELSVDAPAGMEIVNPMGGGHGPCAQNEDMYCCIATFVEGNQTESITCGRRDHSFAIYYPFADKQYYCFAKTTNANAMQLCKSLGSYKGNWNLISPQHHKTGYTNYIMP